MISIFKSRNNNNAFEHIMDRALLLYEKRSIYGIINLQRILIRPLQSEFLATPFKTDSHIRSRYFSYEDFGISYLHHINMTFYDFLNANRIKDEVQILNTTKDVIIPSIWNHERLTNTALGSSFSTWKQNNNHQVIWVHPLNFGWSNNGHHSIANAIITGIGKIKPTQIYNISSLYPFVVFDGLNFIYQDSKEVIGTPRYEVIGWLYELGRLLDNLET